MLIFNKGEGTKWKTVRQWKDKKMEEGESATILVYKQRTKTGSIKGHLKERLEKTNIVMWQVWSIADRKFKEDDV